MKKIIETKKAPLPIGPYSQAVEIKKFLFVSGQIGIDPESGKLLNDNIKIETEQVMENINSILKASNRDFGNVVKTSIFLKDMENFEKVNSIYSQYFNEDTSPARETVEVSRLPKDANVEISIIAF
jgi:2-iminobutanoate/2-iminopropanoate deaminase|tara:strand:- start:64 stop:441 length:378 start_codon:yes stop_codon:yes gene_type:complete